jgi:hypothetical protein
MANYDLLLNNCILADLKDDLPVFHKFIEQKVFTNAESELLELKWVEINS